MRLIFAHNTNSYENIIMQCLGSNEVMFILHVFHEYFIYCIQNNIFVVYMLVK